MPKQIEGSRALVIGGSAGIGLAVAEKLVEGHAQVTLVARNETKLQATARRFRDQGGTVFATPGDIARHEDCVRIVHEAAAHMGGLDVLVNNAGLHHRGEFENHEAGAFAQMVDVNLRAPIVLTRLALPYFERCGGGAIVNVASLAGFVPIPGSAVYSATKFGLRAFSKALAEEFEGKGITVSVVSPGPVATDFILEDLDKVTDLTLSQPMSTAQQIADDVVACIRDGRAERARPAASALLATLGYVAPGLARRLRPLLRRRGRAAREKYRRRAG